MKAPTAGEVLAACRDGDVVYHNWPDGTETMVKGRTFWTRH
jgi:hypothetical protein